MTQTHVHGEHLCPPILIVDDVPENLQILGTILREEGYSIRVGTDGREALRLVGHAHPDLILLDVMMPVMDGYEVCRLLSSDPKTQHIPIIFLTALSSSEDEMKGLELGAVDFITKPFKAEVVLAHVRRHLKLSGRSRDQRLVDADQAYVESLIEAGESERVEFKSTLRWNLHADRSDKEMELAVIRTIVGFLNTTGGTLLVGVADDGAILGVAADRFKSRDKLMLHLNNMLEAHLGTRFAEFMHVDIVDVRGEEILSINPPFP